MKTTRQIGSFKARLETGGTFIIFVTYRIMPSNEIIQKMQI